MVDQIQIPYNRQEKYRIGYRGKSILTGAMYFRSGEIRVRFVSREAYVEYA